MLHSCIKGFLRAKKLWVNPPKAERAKPSLSSDYNLLFKNKIGERSLDIHRMESKNLAYAALACPQTSYSCQFGGKPMDASCHEVLVDNKSPNLIGHDVFGLWALSTAAKRTAKM